MGLPTPERPEHDQLPTETIVTTLRYVTRPSGERDPVDTEGWRITKSGRREPGSVARRLSRRFPSSQLTARAAQCLEPLSLPRHLHEAGESVGEAHLAGRAAADADERGTRDDDGEALRPARGDVEAVEAVEELHAARGLVGGAGADVVHERHPVVDVSVPASPTEMTGILDAIDAALDGGETVYLHCWGGVGRTATAVGCWLVRCGRTGDEALVQVAEWWRGVEKAHRRPQSPETREQRAYVRGWTEPKAR